MYVVEVDIDGEKSMCNRYLTNEGTVRGSGNAAKLGTLEEGIAFAKQWAVRNGKHIPHDEKEYPNQTHLLFSGGRFCVRQYRPKVY